jgi:hypothetical protein
MTKNIPITEWLIFALDVDTKEQAGEWLAQLGEQVHFYKVGLQLFLGGWFRVIKLIRNRGHKVMVDLKFFDIPETVELAVRQLKDRGVLPGIDPRNISSQLMTPAAPWSRHDVGGDAASLPAGSAVPMPPGHWRDTRQ